MPRPPKGVLFSKVDVGQRIRALREERGLSQAELAELLGVHQTNISTMERGLRALTIHQVMKLSKALRVSIDAILTGSKSHDAAKSLTSVKLSRRIQRIADLPERKQRAVLKVLDALLDQQAGGR